MRRVAAVVASAVAASALGACTSTQDKSRALEERAEQLKVQRGLSVPRQNPKVDVLRVQALSDDNGAAVAVELRNTARKDQSRLPIAIDVRDPRGRSAFKNDSPGIEPALRSIPHLERGERTFWVNDQVLTTGKLGKATAKVGFAQEPTPRRLPRIVVENPKLEQDPVDGAYLAGKVRNRSKIDQRDLVLYAVVRRDDRIVAAGRGQVERLRAGKGARFSVFFIGDPRKGEVDVIAPPTVLK